MKKFHWDYQKIRYCKRKGHIPEDRAREMFPMEAQSGDVKNFTSVLCSLNFFWYH